MAWFIKFGKRWFGGVSRIRGRVDHSNILWGDKAGAFEFLTEDAASVMRDGLPMSSRDKLKLVILEAEKVSDKNKSTVRGDRNRSAYEAKKLIEDFRAAATNILLILQTCGYGGRNVMTERAHEKILKKLIERADAISPPVVPDLIPNILEIPPEGEAKLIVTESSRRPVVR